MSSSNGRSSYFYSVYGINIKSDIRLDDLIPALSGEDVNISLGKLNDHDLDKELKDAAVFERPGCLVRVSKNAICYDWTDLGKALIRNGNEVIINPLNGVENEEFAPFITGAVLAILLNQRSILVLHASAVEINDEVVAFLGDKGAGKSTLAAYLQRRGHNLITDDLLPVIFSKKGAIVMPGYPRIKLWADSVKSINLNWESLPKVSKFIDKRSYHCFDNFSTKPVSLNRIYILDENPKIQINRLALTHGFIELTKNTYLGKYLHITGQIAENFEQCKALISAVPIFTLKRPYNHLMLPDVAQEIEKHFI